MRFPYFVALAITLTWFATYNHFASAAIIAGDTADANVRSFDSGNQGGSLQINGLTNDTLRAGRFWNGSNNNTRSNLSSDFVFQLPALGAVTFASATLTFNYASFDGGTYDVDLYGLNDRPASTVMVSDFYFGAAVDPTPNATLLQNSILTSVSALGATESVDISSYLNAQYAGGANAGNYIFLRLSPHGNSNIFSQSNGYLTSSADNATASLRPFITYELVVPPSITPEPTALLLAVMSVVGLTFDRRRGKRVNDGGRHEQRRTW